MRKLSDDPRLSVAAANIAARDRTRISASH